jgi:hypothetical protein
MHELDASRQRAASGYEVVYEKHALPLLYSAHMHLNAILSILQLVAGSYRFTCTSKEVDAAGIGKDAL